MKNFNSWGIKIRRNPFKNYYSIWYQLKTTRLAVGTPEALDPTNSEFYDVGITERCNAMCPFCYVEADALKRDYSNICETWTKWMETFPEDKVINLDTTEDPYLKELCGKPAKENSVEERFLFFLIQQAKIGKLPIKYTEKPFQVAIGSVGEPTMHPYLAKFLETVYNSNVVPNYTTNGIILSNYEKAKEIFEATSAFCGGVAVSYGNVSLRSYANRAIENLLKYGNCKVMIHHIISDKQSVGQFRKSVEQWGEDIHYHVLLPMMAHGRSKEAMNTETFLYLSKTIAKLEIKNIALGANFLPFMKEYPFAIKAWDYPQEIYSKNILLKDNKIIITPSSFNLTSIYEKTF